MFSSNKILQEVSYLLSLNGNRMNLLKLMKELYLIDRLSIEERESSVSGDVFFSMKHGPVLSQTLNMCYDLPNNEWGEYLDQITAPFYPDIAVKKTIETGLLSAKEKEYIEKVSAQFMNYSPRQLEDYTHKLPEWAPLTSGRKKIRFSDIMRALGRSEKEIAEAKAEYEAFNSFCE
jgi:uncharacterized phage-associated protein|nr:MAG TPA: Protein of unknown function (DUF4065) [Caudoviricetes sp.]